MSRAGPVAGLACIICAAILLLPCYGLPRQQGPEKPIETTVCELVKQSDRFAGRLVRLHSGFTSDGMEHSSLIDRKCKTGIEPIIAAEAENDPDIQEFNRALSQGYMGTRDKKVTATFTGRFSCKPNCSATGGRVLEIQQISDLHVTLVKQKHE